MGVFLLPRLADGHKTQPYLPTCNKEPRSLSKKRGFITLAIIYDKSYPPIRHPGEGRGPAYYWFPAFAGTTPGCRIKSGMSEVDVFICRSNNLPRYRHILPLPGMKTCEMAPITKKMMIAAMIMAIV
jgi:hypothetical protein